MMAASFLSLVTGLSVDKTVAFTGSLDLRYGRAQTLWDSLSQHQHHLPHIHTPLFVCANISCILCDIYVHYV